MATTGKSYQRTMPETMEYLNFIAFLIKPIECKYGNHAWMWVITGDSSGTVPEVRKDGAICSCCGLYINIGRPGKARGCMRER